MKAQEVASEVTRKVKYEMQTEQAAKMEGVNTQLKKVELRLALQLLKGVVGSKKDNRLFEAFSKLRSAAPI